MAAPTPPGKENKKAESGPKKPRAPRKDYGFKPGAKITLTDGEKSYKGQRAERYELLKKCNGKTVDEFAKAYKWDDQPRGWIRFFVENEACTLSGGKDPEPKAKKDDKKAA